MLTLWIPSMAVPANAGWQHEWASAYLDWSGASLSQASSVSQVIAPLELAPQTYWSMTWVWDQKNIGGYAGIQTNGNLANGTISNLAIFSIWDATSAVPGPESGCLPFGGEGVGYSCRIPIQMIANNRYEITISADRERGPKWWKASVSHLDKNEVKFIGSIEAPFENLQASNWGNFIEYWGPKLDCSAVRVASAKFYSPLSTNPNIEFHSPKFSLPSKPCVVAAGDTPPQGYVGDAIIRFGGSIQQPSTTSMPYSKTKLQLEKERLEADAKARADAVITPVTKPKNLKKTIVCLKPGTKLKVTAIKPKCPTGYKKK
jgi:hypothetical protein